MNSCKVENRKQDASETAITSIIDHCDVIMRFEWVLIPKRNLRRNRAGLSAQFFVETIILLVFYLTNRYKLS